MVRSPQMSLHNFALVVALGGLVWGCHSEPANSAQSNAAAPQPRSCESYLQRDWGAIPRRPERRACSVTEPSTCGEGFSCVALAEGASCAKVVVRPSELAALPDGIGLVVIEPTPLDIGFGARPGPCRCTTPETFLSVSVYKERVLPLTQAAGETLRGLSCQGEKCGDMKCEIDATKWHRLIGYYHRTKTQWAATFEVVRTESVER